MYEFLVPETSTLFGLYGYDLLYEKHIRFLLLKSLNDAELERLSNSVGIAKKRKKYDLCLSLVSIPWRIGGQIIWKFAETFSIPIEFLPSRSAKNATIETIEPYSAPPNLFDFQTDIADQIVDILKANEKKALLVQLPTGAGKTRTMIESLVTYYMFLVLRIRTKWIKSG